MINISPDFSIEGGKRDKTAGGERRSGNPWRVHLPTIAYKRMAHHLQERSAGAEQELERPYQLSINLPVQEISV